MHLILIAYANSEGSGATAHPRSLTRAFTAHTYVVSIWSDGSFFIRKTARHTDRTDTCFGLHIGMRPH